MGGEIAAYFVFEMFRAKSNVASSFADRDNEMDLPILHCVKVLEKCSGL